MGLGKSYTSGNSFVFIRVLTFRVLDMKEKLKDIFAIIIWAFLCILVLPISWIVNKIGGK
jgi:hypothetical protein